MRFARFFPSLLALCSSPLARAAAPAPAPAGAAVPAVFFVGTDSGPILSVSLDERTGALKQISSTTDGGPAPSWQEMSPANCSILYSASGQPPPDEGRGSLTSLAIGADGSLKKLASTSCLPEPVSLAVSADGRTIFTAHYASSGVSMFTACPITGAIQLVWEHTYKLSAPGAVPDRQEAAHPHQALFDPTGCFVLVADLGADLLRVYSANGTELPSIAVPAGSGPRHGAFFPASARAAPASDSAQPLYFYLVNELANSLSVFAVTYANSMIVLTPLQSVSTLPAPSSSTGGSGTGPVSGPGNSTSGSGSGSGTNPLPTPSAAELAISPDGQFIYVSNRGNDGVFPDNGQGDGNNAIAAFARAGDTGGVKLVGFIPSHVRTPRHFTLDPAGAWLVVAGQGAGGVKAFPRDVQTGEVDSSQAAAGSLAASGPMCVTFASRDGGKGL